MLTAYHDALAAFDVLQSHTVGTTSRTLYLPVIIGLAQAVGFAVRAEQPESHRYELFHGDEYIRTVDLEDDDDDMEDVTDKDVLGRYRFDLLVDINNIFARALGRKGADLARQHGVPRRA